MSDRNQDILRQLIKNKKIKEETLLTEFGVTSRQLSYTIQNINDKLVEKGLAIIEKQQGHFVCPRETIDYLTIHQTLEDIVFSKEDRMYLILIMILTRKEELSLDHFSIELKMSKNTIVNDIKQAKVMLEPFHLEIEFSRKEGYRIHGKEWDKRIVLSHALTKIYKIYGENVTNELLVNTHKYIEMARKAVLRIEKYLGIKYTDEDFYPLTYLLATVLIRIERKQLVTIEDFKDPDEIKHTKEYQALSYVFTEFPFLSQSEILYIALQLLSANVRSNQVFTELDLPLLSNSLWEFLIEFETNTFLALKDKKALLGKLSNHFKPAYYQIKYNFPVDNVLYEKIISEYRAGIAVQAFANRLMHLGFSVSLVGEISSPHSQEGDLLIICLGSGEMGSLKNLATKAKQSGVNIALITMKKNSTIGQLADSILVLPKMRINEKEILFLNRWVQVLNNSPF